MAKKILVKTFKRIALLAVALIAAVIGIFLFTRPMLAPGYQKNNPNLNINNNESSNEGTYAVYDAQKEIGKDVEADSYLIFDETTGKIISERKPDTPLAIASITKLMTALVTEKNVDLKSSWTINSQSTSDIRPVLGLTIGDKVKISDLINSMIIGSANDAAAALGSFVESVTNKPMIELMNSQARSLGMKSTHYENPIGWDSEQNYSTANDLKLLLDEIRPMTLFSSLDRKLSYSFTSETGKTYFVKATNPLLNSDPDIHAIKTGYTDQAKGAMITAIHKKEFKFVIIVLGSLDRESDTLLLKSQVLKSFENQ